MSKTIIDKMWNMHLQCIPEYKGRLYVALTGGLDSRILAGIIRHLDLDVILVGHYHYTEKTKGNIEYITELSKLLHYDCFSFFERKDGKKQLWDNINTTYTLKAYICIMHHQGNVPYGSLPTKYLDLNHYLALKKNIDKRFIVDSYFKKMEHPLLDTTWVGFMHSLPRQYRFMESGAIAMIKKYLPDLYKIPRCFERGQEPVSLKHYAIKRLMSKSIQKAKCIL